MTCSKEEKLSELKAFLGWLEAGRTIVPNTSDHADLLAILEGAIARTKFSINTLSEKST
jgi:hypothetical protein